MVQKNKFSLLTPEEKKFLRAFCRYIQSWGLTRVDLRIEVDGYDFENQEIPNYFENAYNVKVPTNLVSFLENLKKKVIDADLWEEKDVENLNYESVEINIDAEDEEIEFVHIISYTVEGDSEGQTWTKDEDNEVVEKIMKIFEDNGLTKEEYTLSYNGSGDSGYIEDNFDDSESAPEEIKDWSYDQLENSYGGWEINEGSRGEFIFDLVNQKISFYHSPNIEENEQDTFYSENFSKS